MNNFNSNELAIILGYYEFESKKNGPKAFKRFTNQFNSYFNKDLSSQVLLYQVSIFNNFNLSSNIDNLSEQNNMHYTLWDKYIVLDRKDLLRKMYNDFKKNIAFDSPIMIQGDDNELIEVLNEKCDKLYSTFSGDNVKLLYEKTSNEINARTRDAKVAFNALVLADYECEYSKNHESFIRKNLNKKYTECHHLIPLKYQDLFDVNLDVEANIVSLCSNCHNNLHYGKDYEVILEKLFYERKERLIKCGISITVEQLINMYR